MKKDGQIPEQSSKEAREPEKPEELIFEPLEEAMPEIDDSEELPGDDEAYWDGDVDWEDDGEWEEETYWQEDSYEEEEDSRLPSKGMIALSIVLLVVVAVIFCVLLWKMTHSDKDNPAVPQTGMQTETTQEPEPETTTESGTGETEPQVQQTVSDATPMPTPLVEEDVVYKDPISGDSTMTFTQASETVTAKDVTNFRSVPDTGDPSNVVHQLKNGEKATRTGINADTGWSRLEYEGQTVYAVSQYLTTDLNYTPPVQANNPNRVGTLDGRVIIFEDWNDYITPKEYVNLRTEPSTSEGNATVKVQVNAGTVMHRTGRSGDSGWSRVEYNGAVLYVVSNYTVTTEATANTPTPVPAPTPVPTQAPADTPSAPADTPPEAPVDTPPETPVDTPPETPVDTPPEAPVDTPPEAPVDTPPEAPVDTPPEASVDTPPEAPVDTPPEAPVE